MRILFLLCFFSINVFAQNVCVPLIQKGFAIPDTLLTKIHNMSLTFSPPIDDFFSNSAGHNFYNVPHINQLHGTMYSIESKDSEFFCCIYARFIDNDAIKTRKEVEENVIRDIKLTKQRNIGKNDEKNLISTRYYSPKEARELFNADTVIGYSVELLDGGFVMKNSKNKSFKYSGNKVLLLQKNERGFIVLYCFYTKKGEKKLSKYMGVIENAFWFIDYCPTLEGVRVIPFSEIEPPRIIN